MEQVVALPSGERLSISISVGVATTERGQLTATALIDHADRALYQAKAAGRNCVRASEETVAVPPPAMADPRFAELALTH